MSFFLSGHERSTWGAGRAVSWRGILRRVSVEISWGKQQQKKKGVAQTRSTVIWPLCLDFFSSELCLQSRWRHTVSAALWSARNKIKKRRPAETYERDDVTERSCRFRRLPLALMRVLDEQRNQRDHLVGLFVRVWVTGWTISRVACGSIPEPSEGRAPPASAKSHAPNALVFCVQSNCKRSLWKPLF